MQNSRKLKYQTNRRPSLELEPPTNNNTSKIDSEINQSFSYLCLVVVYTFKFMSIFTKQIVKPVINSYDLFIQKCSHRRRGNLDTKCTNLHANYGNYTNHTNYATTQYALHRLCIVGAVCLVCIVCIVCVVYKVCMVCIVYVSLRGLHSLRSLLVNLRILHSSFLPVNGYTFGQISHNY